MKLGNALTKLLVQLVNVRLTINNAFRALNNGIL